MPPDNKQAQYVTSLINRLGVRDVQLFYDNQVQLWAVCQIEQVSRGIVTLDNPNLTEVRPSIMWWCREGAMGTYRAPSEKDVSDVIATVQRSETIFKKSESNPDWLDDQLIEAERVKTEKHKKHQDENLRYAIRHYKVQEDIRRSLG